MIPGIKYLTLDEIKIGDVVESVQLEKIYDTYILLSNVVIVQNLSYCTLKGTIIKISDTPLAANGADSVLVYYSSLEAMENGTYE